jgi:hypothetical protein
LWNKSKEISTVETDDDDDDDDDGRFGFRTSLMVAGT